MGTIENIFIMYNLLVSSEYPVFSALMVLCLLIVAERRKRRQTE
jgi:hypothetical protein